MAMASLLISSSNADNIIIQPDTPNIGDTTTITTYNSGTAASTGNVISQTFNDGSWTGTMFPDSSDLNEANILTGKHNKYAETTVSSQGIMTEEEIKQGFTSNFSADIRWWNSQESTVTMTQTATDNLGNTTTQSSLLVDTTNHNYQYNNYGNTLVVSPSEELTHGNITARFDFNILGNANYNGGHAGTDVTNPELSIDYQTLNSVTVTTVQYCWEKYPPTCPGQDEIQDVENIIDELETFYFIPEEEIYIDTYTFEPEIYTWEPEIVMDIQEQSFEMELFTVEMDEFIPDFETIEVIDMPMDISMDMPELEMFEVEEFNTEEFVDDFVDEPLPELEPTDIIEEEVIEEQPIEETNEPEIETQSSSEEPIANEPAPKQEAIVKDETTEEPIKVAATQGDTAEEPVTTKENVEVDLDIKVAKIEKAIKSQINNRIQQVQATLAVVNELVSREMISNQPDISSYSMINTAMFDTRQLPQGNMDFFNEIILTGYDKTIYNNQIVMSTIDPVAAHQIKMQEAKEKTNKAYYKFKELLNARNGI